MGEDIDNFQFNTAIARSMELLNKINDYIRENDNINTKVVIETVRTYIKLLAPLAPHFAEEQWSKLGNTESVHKQQWPEINQKEMDGGTKNIPIQVNGKLKTCITVPADATPDEILTAIKETPQVIEIFEKNDVKKEIYVPGRIYNLVI